MLTSGKNFASQMPRQLVWSCAFAPPHDPPAKGGTETKASCTHDADCPHIPDTAGGGLLSRHTVPNHFTMKRLFCWQFLIGIRIAESGRAENRTPPPVASPVRDRKTSLCRCTSAGFRHPHASRRRTGHDVGYNRAVGKEFRRVVAGFDTRHRRFSFELQGQPARNRQPD